MNYITGYSDPLDYDLFIKKRILTLPVYKGKIAGMKKVRLDGNRYFISNDTGMVMIITRRK